MYNILQHVQQVQDVGYVSQVKHEEMYATQAASRHLECSTFLLDVFFCRFCRYVAMRLMRLYFEAV